MKTFYSLSSTCLNLLVAIYEKMGEIKSYHLTSPFIKSDNFSNFVYSSLAIDNVDLDFDFVSELLHGDMLKCNTKVEMGVKNCAGLYKVLDKTNYRGINSLVSVHRKVFDGIHLFAGKFRNRTDGSIYSKFNHYAPPSTMVVSFLDNLFDYIENGIDLPIVKACIFHYEMIYISPFKYGNDLIGRFWQIILLNKWFPTFDFSSLNVYINDKHVEYFEAIKMSIELGEVEPFLKFMLGVLLNYFDDFLKVNNPVMSKEDRLNWFRSIIKNEVFSRKDYLSQLKSISTATASRDLCFAVKEGIISKMGDKKGTTYRFI